MTDKQLAEILGRKMTKAIAITLLREAWEDGAIRLAAEESPLHQISKNTWNEICDVLGFADRFKL